MIKPKAVSNEQFKALAEKRKTEEVAEEEALIAMIMTPDDMIENAQKKMRLMMAGREAAPQKSNDDLQEKMKQRMADLLGPKAEVKAANTKTPKELVAEMNAKMSAMMSSTAMIQKVHELKAAQEDEVLLKSLMTEESRTSGGIKMLANGTRFEQEPSADGKYLGNDGKWKIKFEPVPQAARKAPVRDAQGKICNPIIAKAPIRSAGEMLSLAGSQMTRMTGYGLEAAPAITPTAWGQMGGQTQEALLQQYYQAMSVGDAGSMAGAWQSMQQGGKR